MKGLRCVVFDAVALIRLQNIAVDLLGLLITRTPSLSGPRRLRDELPPVDSVSIAKEQPIIIAIRKAVRAVSCTRQSWAKKCQVGRRDRSPECSRPL